ncbi:hypothetical protein [Vibrio alfacsensis]|uniref:hypothetical protein n=1 Tax=Vibrio alfacsensis TaxID=1074311 RepID=UPI0040680FB3
MRVNKSTCLAFFLILLSTYLIFIAQSQLRKSISTNGIELSINRFTDQKIKNNSVESMSHSLDLILDGKMLNSFDYELIAIKATPYS